LVLTPIAEVSGRKSRRQRLASCSLCRRIYPRCSARNWSAKFRPVGKIHLQRATIRILQDVVTATVQSATYHSGVTIEFSAPKGAEATKCVPSTAPPPLPRMSSRGSNSNSPIFSQVLLKAHRCFCTLRRMLPPGEPR